MALSRSSRDCGSDEVRDTVVDICAYCATRDKLQPASYFCYDCGVFGRYICGICHQHHNLFTNNHDVKSISGNGLDTRKQLQKKNDELRRSNSDKEKQLAERNNQLQLIERECSDLKTRVKRLREDLQIKISRVASLEDEIEKEKRGEMANFQGGLKENYEKEIEVAEVKIRTLSSDVEILKTDMKGIEDIVKLFKRYRPTICCERYSEIYDNEWTEAFQELIDNNISEEECIAFLLSLLLDVSEICKRWSREHKHRFQEISQSFKKKYKMLRWPWEDESSKAPTYGWEYEWRLFSSSGLEQQKLIQLLLFADYELKRDDIIKSCLTEVRAPKGATKLIKGREVSRFINICIKVCLHMSLLELELGKIPKKMDKFDTTVYRPYTMTGPFINFVVWPPVYFQENGTLLTKGVAQPLKGN